MDLIDYVPVGTTSFHVSDTAGFHAGDTVVIERASTLEWIHALGMDNIAQCVAPGCHQWGAVLHPAAISGVQMSTCCPTNVVLPR